MKISLGEVTKIFYHEINKINNPSGSFAIENIAILNMVSKGIIPVEKGNFPELRDWKMWLTEEEIIYRIIADPTEALKPMTKIHNHDKN